MRRVCPGDAFAVVAAVLAMVGCNGQVGGPQEASEPPPPATLASANDAVVGPERPAIQYAEAVVIEPNDSHAETCTGVVIAPRVVLTAAHCVVYVPAKTWKVTAPFADGGPETHTARDGEPMDAAFRNVSRAEYIQHELRDVALLYLDVPFASPYLELPTLQPNGYAAEKDAAPSYVAAVGRSTAGVTAGLALSATTSLEAPAPALASIAYATARLTAAGESGGPLFVEGTHKLVAVHAHVDPTGKTDMWARLDGDVYTWITQKVAAHGGWTVDSPP